MSHMKIERIDDKTVKCFLSNEELEEYEIDYKDFVLRSDKAKEIVKEIIEQAEEEVGYKPPQFAFDLQIMMLPDKGMVLTFSEKEPFDAKEGDQILEYLKEMKDAIRRAKEKIGQSTGNVDSLENTLAKDAGSTEGTQGSTVQQGQSVRPDFAVFAFESIGNVMDYATAMPKGLRVSSELYKMDDRYYLYLKKDKASYERYSRACVQALEFGGLYAADEEGLVLIKEHGECLISEKALKKLRLY